MSVTTITQLPDPSGFSSDPFTGVLRDGARKLIEQAIHAELVALINAFSGGRLEDGRARLVRHGHLPEREVMTGIGPVRVKVPRVRDRATGEEKITFTPQKRLRAIGMGTVNFSTLWSTGPNQSTTGKGGAIHVSNVRYRAYKENGIVRTRTSTKVRVNRVPNMECTVSLSWKKKRSPMNGVESS